MAAGAGDWPSVTGAAVAVAGTVVAVAVAAAAVAGTVAAVTAGAKGVAGGGVMSSISMCETTFTAYAVGAGVAAADTVADGTAGMSVASGCAAVCLGRAVASADCAAGACGTAARTVTPHSSTTKTRDNICKSERCLEDMRHPFRRSF